MEDKIVIMEGEVHRAEKRYDNDIEYVRKDALSEWLQKEFDTNKWYYDTHAKPNELHTGRCEAYKKVMDKINSL